MTTTPSCRSIKFGSGSKITTLIAPEDSGGAFSLYRWDLAPTTRGPSAHFHRSFAETFLLLEGEVAFNDGRVWGELTVGTAVTAPARQVHALRKLNDEAATVLMLFVPGVGRDMYFAELLALAEDAPRATVRDLHLRHDNHFDLPPDERRRGEPFDVDSPITLTTEL